MSEPTEPADRAHWLEPPLWWRRYRPLRWVLALGLLWGLLRVFGLDGYLHLPSSIVPAFLRSEPHPETAYYTSREPGLPMCDRFVSYASVESARDSLAAGGYGEVSQRARHSAPSDLYPPYDFDTLEVQGYEHLGVRGRLTLEFFNDRLSEVEFDPADARVYARRIRALELKHNRNARGEKIDGDLRIASTVDLAVSRVGQQLGTKPYVLWQDLRLLRQRNQWDVQFGAIPRELLEDRN